MESKGPDVTIDDSDEEEKELTEEEMKQLSDTANLSVGKDELGRRRGFSNSNNPNNGPHK